MRRFSYGICFTSSFSDAGRCFGTGRLTFSLGVIMRRVIAHFRTTRQWPPPDLWRGDPFWCVIGRGYVYVCHGRELWLSRTEVSRVFWWLRDCRDAELLAAWRELMRLAADQALRVGDVAAWAAYQGPNIDMFWSYHVRTYLAEVNLRLSLLAYLVESTLRFYGYGYHIIQGDEHA